MRYLRCFRRLVKSKVDRARPGFDVEEVFGERGRWSQAIARRGYWAREVGQEEWRAELAGD